MARVRDYAAEYQARKALEQERARAEQRPYEPGRARGHRDVAAERLNSSLRYWIARTAYSLDPAEYRAQVQDAITMQGGDYQAKAEVLVFLKAKKASVRDPLGVGRDRWNNRPLWLPPELFFYHSGESDTGDE